MAKKKLKKQSGFWYHTDAFANLDAALEATGYIFGHLYLVSSDKTLRPNLSKVIFGHLEVIEMKKLQQKI